MRSRSEQQDLLEVSTYRELQLLSEVEGTPDVTQRQLSSRVGIALGLTNLLLRNLVQKGYVRVSQASWKRRLYTLTPDGFSRRLHLMVTYICRVLDHYGRVRVALREQLEPLALNVESRVAIFGTGEFAELVYLGLREIGIEEIDVFQSEVANGNKFLGMPIRDLATLSRDNYDRVVLAVLKPSDSTFKNLRQQGVTSEQLVTFLAERKSSEGL